MESAATEVVARAAEFGPEWLFAVVVCGLLVFAVIKFIPMLQEWNLQRLELQKTEAEGRHEIEVMREKRKAGEEASREQRDRERSEAEGRWAAQYDRAVAAQEKSNVVIEALKNQIEVQNAQLMDSKANSKSMGEHLANIEKMVSTMHGELMK